MTLHGGSIEKENGNTPNTNNSNIELNQLFHSSPPHPSQIRRSHHTKPITHGTIHVLTTPNPTPQRQHFTTTPPHHLHINSVAATTTTPVMKPSQPQTPDLISATTTTTPPFQSCHNCHHYTHLRSAAVATTPSQTRRSCSHSHTHHPTYPSPQLKFVAVQPEAKNRSKKNRTGKELQRRFETRWCGEQAAISRTTTTTHEPRAEPEQRRNLPPI
ncbi:hypothetical protein QL285_065282 [Trifolium repens]|nr:hypothetical protein QL285_065282 [Trifolium repens]